MNMYCRNCGKEVAPGGEYCMSCGARPLAGTAYCPSCAGATTPLSEICVKCGTKLVIQAQTAARVMPQHSKSKVASILLAVFLTFWTWLYTYKKDGWKFWTGLGISLACGIVTTVIITVKTSSLNGFNGSIDESVVTDLLVQLMTVFVISSLVSFGLWIWAVVDSAIKKNEWYSDYPDVK
jgi:hypothetical protein